MPYINGDATFMGHATRDMVIHDGGKTPVARFGLAVNAGFGDKAHTNFLEVAVFGKPTEFIDVRKGDLVAMHGGSVKLTEYQGNKRLEYVGGFCENLSHWMRYKNGEEDKSEEDDVAPF
jgi:single-stranded DNA-binding protein